MLGTKRVKWMMQTIIDCLKATEVQVDVDYLILGMFQQREQFEDDRQLLFSGRSEKDPVLLLGDRHLGGRDEGCGFRPHSLHHERRPGET